VSHPAAIAASRPHNGNNTTSSKPLSSRNRAYGIRDIFATEENAQQDGSVEAKGGTKQIAAAGTGPANSSHECHQALPKAAVPVPYQQC